MESLEEPEAISTCLSIARIQQVRPSPWSSPRREQSGGGRSTSPPPPRKEALAAKGRRTSDTPRMEAAAAPRVSWDALDLSVAENESSEGWYEKLRWSLLLFQGLCSYRNGSPGALRWRPW